MSLDDLLAANQRWTAEFPASGLPMEPTRGLAVLTCMDARFGVEGMLGLKLGDAHIVRNAGGRASDDALRSLALSAALLGTRQCMVIHHTDCGLQGVTNRGLRARVGEVTGTMPDLDFLPFSDLEQSVRDDVVAMCSSTLLPPDYEVGGFVYDVTTGRLHYLAGRQRGVPLVPYRRSRSALIDREPHSLG
jgi:carbonic anhydrase